MGFNSAFKGLNNQGKEEEARVHQASTRQRTINMGILTKKAKSIQT
jgi:hypothetical protein